MTATLLIGGWLMAFAIAMGLHLWEEGLCEEG
jgi:hypothetical protein